MGFFNGPLSQLAILRSIVAQAGKRKMASFNGQGLVACCQMTSTANKEENMKTCAKLIGDASSAGCKMIFLPECFDYVSLNKEDSIKMAEPINGPTIKFYQELSQKHNVWLSLGGFHQQGPPGEPNRIVNTHIVLNDNGEIVQTYAKVHLFSVNIKDGAVLRENEHTIPGDKIPEPVHTPVGKVGLQICYDIRFPEESIIQSQMGAEILTYPSAFTVFTGMAHWEVLLRARAIENQCYVVAATQTGQHSEKRRSYGHAMIVDPWGAVIAQASEGTGFCIARIDLEYLKKVREGLPVAEHKRKDLYEILRKCQTTL